MYLRAEGAVSNSKEVEVVLIPLPPIIQLFSYSVIQFSFMFIFYPYVAIMRGKCSSPN